MLRDTVRWYVAQHKHGYGLDWRDKVIKQLTQYDTDYQYSKTPSRKEERLDEERQTLIEILEDAEEIVDCGKPYYKASAQTAWCGLTGANARQFRRRLAEMPEELRKVYDRLKDGRQR
jgi:hypothetical protein